MLASSVSIITLPTKCTHSPGTPSDSRFASASADVVNSHLEMRSVKTRLISSGMFQSRDRNPASTWATGMPNFTAAIAQAIVELTSPTTTTASISRFWRYASKATMTPAVCSAWLPEPMSRLTSGSGMPRSRKKPPDIRSS